MSGYGEDFGADFGGETPPPTTALLGESTLGNATLGPRHELDYRIDVQTSTGDRLPLRNLHAIQVTRTHTDLSSWEATVPTPAENVEGRLLSEVWIKWGDVHLFNGRLDVSNGQLNDPAVTIGGDGIGWTLTRGDFAFDFRNVRYKEAIRRVWGATGFEATVSAPPLEDDPDHPANLRIVTDEDLDDEELEEAATYSGTPMEILQTLHENSGMRFTILHSHPGRRVESYVAGDERRQHDWDVLDGERDTSAKEYANRVVVTGALKNDGSGERIKAVAKDAEEIERLAALELGPNADGVITYPIRNPDEYDTHEKAQAQADAKLDELVDADTVGGRLEIHPAVAAPGYDYLIEEFGGGSQAYGEGAYGEGPYGSEAPQYVTLNEVTYSANATLDENQCNLDLSQQLDLLDQLRIGILQGGGR